MSETPTVAAPYYQGWDGYQQHLLDAIGPLTPEQLALRPAPHLRSVGELATHIALVRAGWLYFVLQVGGDVRLGRRCGKGAPRRRNHRGVAGHLGGDRGRPRPLVVCRAARTGQGCRGRRDGSLAHAPVGPLASLGARYAPRRRVVIRPRDARGTGDRAVASRAPPLAADAPVVPVVCHLGSATQVFNGTLWTRAR